MGKEKTDTSGVFRWHTYASWMH